MFAIIKSELVMFSPPNVVSLKRVYAENLRSSKENVKPSLYLTILTIGNPLCERNNNGKKET